MNYITFSHSGRCGDCIYSIGTIQEIMRKNPDRKSKLYLIPNIPTNDYYSDKFRLTLDSIKALIPLLKLIVDEVEIGVGPMSVDINLDAFRHSGCALAGSTLPMHYQFVFEAYPDISKPWIDVEPYVGTGLENYILINRSLRYRNPKIDYSFLRDYPTAFIGLHSEFENFEKNIKDCKYIETANFLEVARMIKTCKLFIANQSACFAIAEISKVNRLLETCLYAPNVVPVGGKGIPYVNQLGFIKGVEYLYYGG